MKVPYAVNIQSADNGLIVNIGCKTLVFMNGTPIGDFMADLKVYLTEKDGYQKMATKYFPEEQPQRMEDPCCDVPHAAEKRERTQAFGVAGAGSRRW